MRRARWLIAGVSAPGPPSPHERREHRAHKAREERDHQIGWSPFDPAQDRNRGASEDGLQSLVGQESTARLGPPRLQGTRARMIGATRGLRLTWRSLDYLIRA